MNYDLHDFNLPKEGELYKIYEVGGYTFEIRYGYYEENERGRVEPLPIFPDFRKKLVYTEDGYPLTSLIHSSCQYYKSQEARPENYCGDCIHYSVPKQEISICKCEERRRNENDESETLNGGMAI